MQYNIGENPKGISDRKNSTLVALRLQYVAKVLLCDLMANLPCLPPSGHNSASQGLSRSEKCCIPLERSMRQSYCR